MKWWPPEPKVTGSNPFGDTWVYMSATEGAVSINACGVCVYATQLPPVFELRAAAWLIPSLPISASSLQIPENPGKFDSTTALTTAPEIGEKEHRGEHRKMLGIEPIWSPKNRWSLGSWGELQGLK